MLHLLRTFLLLLPLVCAAQPQWEEITPLPNHEVRGISKHVTPESGIWACVCSYEGLCFDSGFRPFFSSDGGNTWEIRDGDLPTGVGVQDVAANPHNPNRLLATTMAAPGQNLGPWSSTDQGRHWTAIRHNFYGGSIYDHWIQSGWFADGVHAWFAIETGFVGGWIYTSSDSGETFPDSSVERYGDWLSFLPHPQLPGIGWLGTALLFRTTDFGHTWTQLPYEEFQYFVMGDVGQGPERVYANAMCIVGGPGHQRYVCLNVVSQDTGQTWSFLNSADTILWNGSRQEIFDVLLDPLQPGHLLGLTYDSVFESRDDGQNYQAIIGDTSYSMHWFGYDASRDWFFAAGARNLGGDVYQRGLWRWRRELAVSPCHRVPQQLALYQNYPNPFNPTTEIRFDVPKAEHVQLRIYNSLGQLVTTLIDEQRPAGSYTMPWDGRNVSTGLYFCRLEAGRFVQAQKMLLLK